MGLLKNFKEKREVKAKAIKEGEKIFMKLNPDMAMKNGSFPKADEFTPRAYNKEASRVEKQVVSTRVKQWRANKRASKFSDAGTPFNAKMYRQIEREKRKEERKTRRLLK